MKTAIFQLALATLSTSTTLAFTGLSCTHIKALPATSRPSAVSPLFSPSRSTRSLSTTALQGFFGDFKGLTSIFDATNKEAEEIVPQFDAVVIEPDFRVAALFLGVGILLDWVPYVQFVLGLPVTLLGLLFLVQTFRIRFIFDQENALELATNNGTDGSLTSSGENIIVGGANRWKCDTIVNYDFFPQGWMDGPFGQPILVYFKETQTPQEGWNEGPGQAANAPAKVEAGIGE
jgi:hypothetical protein